jgi:hypothetical protein
MGNNTIATPSYLVLNQMEEAHRNFEIAAILDLIEEILSYSTARGEKVKQLYGTRN